MANIGIFIVLGCVFGGFFMMGGAVHAIWQPVELIVIAGAAVGAWCWATPACAR
jgi:chemotaxis protein MotA